MTKSAGFAAWRLVLLCGILLALAACADEQGETNYNAAGPNLAQPPPGHSYFQ